MCINKESYFLKLQNSDLCERKVMSVDWVESVSFYLRDYLRSYEGTLSWAFLFTTHWMSRISESAKSHVNNAYWAWKINIVL